LPTDETGSLPQVDEPQSVSLAAHAPAPPSAAASHFSINTLP
jgi:hypothetical protein